MSPRAPAAPQLLTVAEAADRLGVHPNRIYEWINAGHLGSLRLPGRGKRPGVHRIPEDVLATFIKACEGAA